MYEIVLNDKSLYGNMLENMFDKYRGEPKLLLIGGVGRGLALVAWDIGCQAVEREEAIQTQILSGYSKTVISPQPMT